MCHNCVCLYVCVFRDFSKGSFIWHTHAHTQRERLQHRKVLSGQGTVAGEAATACSNSTDTGLTYLREG